MLCSMFRKQLQQVSIEEAAPFQFQMEKVKVVCQLIVWIKQDPSRTGQASFQLVQVVILPDYYPHLVWLNTKTSISNKTERTHLQFKVTLKNFLLLERDKESSRISTNWRKKDWECMKKKRLASQQDVVSLEKSKISKVDMVIVIVRS